MPYATNQGTRLYWEEVGHGEPVLAVMGLSFPLEMWHRTAPVLAQHFRMILFDNRGAGRSDVPRGPYRIRKMAEDAAAVLDFAGVRRAHVMGASMGGMISQEFALRYPERVRSLMLGCTWCGGLHAIRPEIAYMRRLGVYNEMTPEEKIRALIPLLYAPETPAERIEEDILLRLARLPSARGYYGQLLGTLMWNSWGRLPKLQAPVQIIHGELDRLIPSANAHVLSSRIHHARTYLIPGAGHVFTTDQPELANRAAIEFLLEMNDVTDRERRVA